MLSKFQDVLSADKSLNSKHVPHYIRWVRECYCFFRLPPTERICPEQIHLFLSSLEKSREPWQVKQAEQALRSFDYFLSTTFPDSTPVLADANAWSGVLDQTRDVLRVKQLILPTLPAKTPSACAAPSTEPYPGKENHPRRFFPAL